MLGVGRWTFRILPLCLAVALLFGTAAAAQNPGSVYTAPAARAAEKALGYLAGRQRDSGAWEIGNEEREEDVGVTALAGLAFLAGGHTPGRGPHGAVVSRAVDYVLSRARRNGYLGGRHSRMYGHGFAVLFLAEVHGMTEDPAVGRALRAGVRLALSGQRPDGGWRYTYQPVGPSDLSVTVCQIVALRAAHNAGIAVPASALDKATAYVKKTAEPEGGFRYMTTSGRSGSLAMTAAGLTALYWAGAYDAPEIPGALARLGELARFGPGEDHFYYTHYYAAQALFQAGGRHWLGYYPGARDTLAATQSRDGSWPGSVGPDLTAALGAIVLQVPRQLLPIFQR
jgi:hypothetical protein